MDFSAPLNKTFTKRDIQLISSLEVFDYIGQSSIVGRREAARLLRGRRKSETVGRRLPSCDLVYLIRHYVLSSTIVWKTKQNWFFHGHDFSVRAFLSCQRYQPAQHLFFTLGKQCAKYKIKYCICKPRRRLWGTVSVPILLAAFANIK